MNSLNDNIITWNLNYKRLLCYQKTVAMLGVEKNDSRYFISLAENRSDEVVANMTIILIRQAISLIHRYLDRVSENFANEGGFKERMTRVRLNVRNKNNQ